MVQIITSKGGCGGKFLKPGDNVSELNNDAGYSSIEYVTQVEYNALLPDAETNGKHYFICEGISVKGVLLNESSISLENVGDTYQLVATIIPNNAEDKTVSWSSSDTSVATVDSNGLVTCVTPGNATITVTTNDGGFTATCGVVGGGWTPDPTRTIFYYDFEDSNNRLADSSGNNNDATSTTAITYTTVGTQTVAETTGRPCGIHVNGNLSGNIGSGDFATSFWIYCVEPLSNVQPMLFGLFSFNGSPREGITIFYNPKNSYGEGNCVLWRLTGSNTKSGTITASGLYNGWHHFVMTRNSGVVTCYIDAVQDISFTDNTVLPSSNTLGTLLSRYNDSYQSFPSGAKGDKFILENVGWGSQDVSNYFNQTKGDYGIS